MRLFLAGIRSLTRCVRIPPKSLKTKDFNFSAKFLIEKVGYRKHFGMSAKFMHKLFLQRSFELNETTPPELESKIPIYKSH